MLISFSNGAGSVRSTIPSGSVVTLGASSVNLKTQISFVVGRMPSSRNLDPSRAFTTEDLPELYSPEGQVLEEGVGAHVPTTTTRKSSSSCLTAASKSERSSISGEIRWSVSRHLDKSAFSF